MPAISTLSCNKGMAGRRSEYAGIILLLVACSFIGCGFGYMLRIVKPDHHRSHGRAGQRVVEALHRRQRNSERRSLGIEQASPCVSLHDRNPYLPLFAELIQFFAFRGDPAQIFIVFFRKIFL